MRDWLAKQKVTRTINRLQVHHMDAPSYSTWEKTDGYGMLIGWENSELVKSTELNNFMWGGKVRPATDDEIEEFMKSLMHQTKGIEDRR